MFNMKFIQPIKDALNSKQILNSQKSEELVESLAAKELKIKSDEQRLEAMVREQLKEEFPNIEKSPSYDLLVDAVIHNYKSKQLQATDDIKISD